MPSSLPAPASVSWPTRPRPHAPRPPPGYLITRGLMPVRTLLSAIGFTFSLVFATQGALQTFADCRTLLASVRRVQTVRGAGQDRAGGAGRGGAGSPAAMHAAGACCWPTHPLVALMQRLEEAAMR